MGPNDNEVDGWLEAAYEERTELDDNDREDEDED